MPRKNLYFTLINDIKITSSNYSNMYQRLSRRNFALNFFIIYYSVIIIIISLIPIYFTKLNNKSNAIGFLSIAGSIIVLSVSISIVFSKYSERIGKCIVSIDNLKKLKKTIQSKEELGLEQEEYNEYINKYHTIIDAMELRSDIDFWLTQKNVNKATTVTKKCTFFYFIREVSFWGKYLGEHVFYFLLFVLPILITFYIIF